jgi:hypothetical protein
VIVFATVGLAVPVAIFQTSIVAVSAGEMLIFQALIVQANGMVKYAVAPAAIVAPEFENPAPKGRMRTFDAIFPAGSNPVTLAVKSIVEFAISALTTAELVTVCVDPAKCANPAPGELATTALAATTPESAGIFAAPKLTK